MEDFMDKEMIKRYFVPLFDGGLLIFSYLLSFLIRYDFNLNNFSLHYNGNPRSFVIVMGVHAVFYILFRIRYTVWHQTSLDELLRILVMNSSSAIVLFFLRMSNLLVGHPLAVIVMMLMFNITLMYLARASYRYVRTYNMQRQRSVDGERIIIYGAGSAGRMIVSEIMENKEYNYHVAAILDDNPSLKGSRINGVLVIGGREKVEYAIKKFGVKTIIVAMPSTSKKLRQEILQMLTQLKVDVKVVSSSQSLLEGQDFRRSLRKVNVLDLLGRQEIVIDDEEIHKTLKNKNVMVTGAGGSIGSELVRQIIQKNPKRLILLDINETGLYDIEQELVIKIREGKIPPTELVTLVKSIRDYDSLDTIFKMTEPDIVYHAAAHKHVPLMETVPEEAIKNNILGTHNLIRVSLKYKIDKFVNISTDKAVNPTNVMGATKRFIEMMLQAYNNDTTRFVAVRFGNVLGSNGSVVPLFEKQIANGGPITLTHPEITRYFMTIPEAVSLVLQAGVYAEGGEIFVLDMGDEVKIKDMALKMIELSGLRPHKDIRIEYVGLRPGEKLYEELLMAEEGMTKTPNDLIYIANPIQYSVSDIEAGILEIRDALRTPGYYYPQLLERLVPTYIRN